LEDETHYELKLAVIKALARCGDMKAVEPLYNLSKQVIIPPSMKTEAKKSIAGIQYRFGTGDKGWLSLNDSDSSDGSLSLLDKDDDTTQEDG